MNVCTFNTDPVRNRGNIKRDYHGNYISSTETYFGYKLNLLQVRLSDRLGPGFSLSNREARPAHDLSNRMVKCTVAALDTPVLKSVVSVINNAKRLQADPARKHHLKSVVSIVAKDACKDKSHIEEHGDDIRKNAYFGKGRELMTQKHVIKCQKIDKGDNQTVVKTMKEDGPTCKVQLNIKGHQSKENEKCEKQLHPAYIGKDDMNIDCVVLPFTGPEGHDCFEFQTEAELNSIQLIHNITQFGHLELDRILGLISYLRRTKILN